MTMRVTRVEDAEPFSPAGHHGVGPVRLQGGSETPTTTFTVALSHYLPGGTAELAPQESETVYVENRTNVPSSMLVIRATS